MASLSRYARSFVIAALAPSLVLAIGACGSSKKSSSSSSSGAAKGGSVSLSISESGGKAQFTAPASVKGGLVTVILKNQTRNVRTAQFVLIKGKHTLGDALKVLKGNGKTPAWMRAEGGLPATAPGFTSTATVNLPAGKYGLVEVPGPTSTGPPTATQIRVTPGSAGRLPSTATTVSAATNGKDRYKWRISGTLHPGIKPLTFKSHGKDAIHLIAAVRLIGHPSKTAIIKGLSTNGKPPAFFDLKTFAETAALDGGKSQVTELPIAGPGTYVLFCPITDRNGGKPHFAKGLLTNVTVK